MDNLKNLVNVTGHEYSEMVTDPRGISWYDSTGYENADKCAWTFSGNAVLGYKIQGNWSNHAYDTVQGYTRGCIDGTQTITP